MFVATQASDIPSIIHASKFNPTFKAVFLKMVIGDGQSKYIVEDVTL